MSVKFFGQFLVGRGEIDGGQLCEALDEVNRSHVPLGQIARREGMLSDEQAERLNQLQRSTDRPFGKLAIEQGLLGAEQVDRLLARQREISVRVGEALVELGHLEAERLGVLLDEFKQDQAIYENGEVSLPEAFTGNAAAELTLDFLPKLARRIARVQWKLGSAGPVDRVTRLARRASVTIAANVRLEIVFAADARLAEVIASATCGLPIADLDEELVLDGVGEFLNIVAGNVLAALEKRGETGTLAPPCFAPKIEDGHEIELVSSEGEGALLLRRAG